MPSRWLPFVQDDVVFCSLKSFSRNIPASTAIFPFFRWDLIFLKLKDNSIIKGNIVMSKTPACSHKDPKPVQTDIPAKTQKGKTNDLIERAAEQLADLLLKCWLARNNPRAEKRTKSDSQSDSLKSS